jgi:hypothetical protein
MLIAQERQCTKCKATYVWWPGKGEGEVERDYCPKCRIVPEGAEGDNGGQGNE